MLDKGIPLTKALLAEINSTVKSHNGILLVSMIPSPMQVYPDTYREVLRATFPDDLLLMRFLEHPTRAQRIIRAMCEELGLPFLDMYDVLAAKKNQAFYNPADGHFNGAGHTAFAESLAQFVSGRAVAK